MSTSCNCAELDYGLCYFCIEEIREEGRNEEEEYCNDDEDESRFMEEIMELSREIDENAQLVITDSRELCEDLPF